MLFCGALLWLTGCASVPGDNAEALPPNWGETNTVVRPPASPSVSPVVMISPAVKNNVPPLSVQFNAVPMQVSVPAVRLAPVPAWTSLNRWAAENQCAAPRRLVGGPTVSYAVRSPHGELVVDIGSREATWRGVEFHLGFPPEFIDDQVFVHGLDLQKNLAPLLLGEPPVLGANRVIVIDPGHGGVNGGTVSTLDGRPEKEFTLDWARRIQVLLSAEGWTVWLTRSNDVDEHCPTGSRLRKRTMRGCLSACTLIPPRRTSGSRAWKPTVSRRRGCPRRLRAAIRIFSTRVFPTMNSTCKTCCWRCGCTPRCCA